MSIERAKKLFEHPAITATDKADISIYHGAVIETMNACRKNFTAALRKDLEAAKEGLKETVDRLWPVYFPGEATSADTAPGEWFKNETEAYKYLISLGYEICRSKFNNDKNKGHLKLDGKRVSKFSVLQYGLRLKQTQKAQSGAINGDLQTRKEIADTEKAEHDARISRVKADDVERELDRRWLYRDIAVSDLATIIASLQQALDHAVVTSAAAVIRCAGGDITRTFDVSEAVSELIIVRAFNEVAAAGTLRVKFKGEQEVDE